MTRSVRKNLSDLQDENNFYTDPPASAAPRLQREDRRGNNFYRFGIGSHRNYDS